MGDKVKFGVIGCGNIASRSMIPAIVRSEQAQLVAVASRSLEKAQSVATTFHCDAIAGYDNLLDRGDIDAVYIALPIGLHREWCLKAAAKNKHILCEKTLTSNFAETEEVLKASKSNKVAILEGYAYQYHRQHQLVKETIEAGEIGEPLVFRAWFGIPPIKSEHRYDPSLGGGALLDAGTYTVHAARKFFAAEPEIIGAILDNAGHQVDTQGSVLLGFGNGKSAQLAFGFNNMYRNTYSVWGTKGIVTLHRVFSIPPSFSSTLIVEKQGLKIERAMPTCDHFYEQVKYFSKNLLENEYHERWRNDSFNQAIVLDQIRKNANAWQNPEKGHKR